MNTSLFELFKIGIGPSSSHTVGPMRAASRFIRELGEAGLLGRVERVCVELYGSLAMTGVGHGTDRAILLGLMGEVPDEIDPDTIEILIADLLQKQRLRLGGTREIVFRPSEDLLFRHAEMYPPGTTVQNAHPNGLRFTAYAPRESEVMRSVFYSIGGGFVVLAGELKRDPTGEAPWRTVPFPFSSAADLLQTADKNRRSIAEVIMENECALLRLDADRGTIVRPRLPGGRQQTPPKPEETARLGLDGVQTAAAESAESDVRRVRESILALWHTMQASVERGIATEGTLPGGLNVRRRAPRLAQRIAALDSGSGPRDPLAPLDWVSLYAIAVNEENAAGGRVVTAPTNGAAGVIPAIAHYYMRFIDPQHSPATKEDGLIRFFLTAAAIGILYKENASISGAEVGCQGEVGVACSMAAGGLVAALNGTNAQVEHAAEIAMEHNLGMTCDPIGGLVQIPCIERNAMGAVKAVNACRMAMHETEGHKLSLDQVIETMYRTGLDMQSRYKETSLAGLALNIIEC